MLSGYIFFLFKCKRKVVMPLQRSPSCSPQLLVVDKLGVQWRLHSSHRSLTSLGVEVPCQALVPRIAFRTIEGQYVAQGPKFEVLFLNFLTPSNTPDVLDPAQDKLFVRENPFGADVGLYTVNGVSWRGPLPRTF